MDSVRPTGNLQCRAPKAKQLCRKPDREGGPFARRVSHRFTQINADQRPFDFVFSVCVNPCSSVADGSGELPLTVGLLSHYKIILRSPSRRVTRCRSKYSSKGIAYLREMPASSLN